MPRIAGIDRPTDGRYDRSMGTTYDETSWRAFRAAREDELRRPHGWPTIRGFAWLEPEPTRIARLPGRWWTQDDAARVDAGPADGLRLADGTGAVSGQDAQTAAETGRVPWLVFTGGDAATRGDTEVELLRRGGRSALRWRTRSSPDLEDFPGVPTYTYDPEWVLTGTFTPYADGSRVDAATHRPDLRQSLRAAGDVRFEAGGETQRPVVTSIM